MSTTSKHFGAHRSTGSLLGVSLAVSAVGLLAPPPAVAGNGKGARADSKTGVGVMREARETQSPPFLFLAAIGARVAAVPLAGVHPHPAGPLHPIRRTQKNWRTP